MSFKLKLFALAAALLAAASCSQERMDYVAAGAGKTFSATIAGPQGAGQAHSKAVIDDDGAFRFEEGDYILVFNNNSSNERNISKSHFSQSGGREVVFDASDASRIVAEKIPITAGMLSSGGRSINFSTVVSDVANPDSRANCYHFFYLSAAAYTEWNFTQSRADNNANYAASIGFYRKQMTPYSASDRKVMCYARSSARSGHISFHHFDSQFRFTVSDALVYDKVTIEANGTPGAKNSINPDFTFYPGRVLDYDSDYSGSNLSYNPDSESAGTHPSWNKGAYTYTHNSGAENGSSSINVSLSGDAASVYYVSVPALYTYAEGITFKLYKDGQIQKTVKTDASITTEAGGIINFGDIATAKVVEYTSYYQMWCDGRPFKIGERTIDPTAEPYSALNPVYIEESCNLSSVSGWTNANNIYFIKSGATLTIDSAKYWNDVACTLWIIGDDPEHRSEVVWTKTLAPRGGAVLLKNINITSSVHNSLETEAKLSSYLIVDGCRIVLPNDPSKNGSYGNEFARAVSGASSGWDEIELVNNDFIYAGEVNSVFARILPTAAYTFSSLVVKNNQSYTIDGGLAEFHSCLIWDYWQDRTSFESIDFENNTFVNCAYDYSVIYCAAQGVAVGGNLTVKNNINYVDGEATGYAKLVRLDDGRKTGVSINASNNYAWATGSVGKLQAWGNVSCTAFSADPFASKDFENGIFTLTAAAASLAQGCGAKR